MFAKEAMDHGALGVTIFSPSGMRTEKQLFLRPSHLPPGNYAEWTARSFYEEASWTLSHPRRSGRAIQGWAQCMLGLRGWATRPNLMKNDHYPNVRGFQPRNCTSLLDFQYGDNKSGASWLPIRTSQAAIQILPERD